MRTTRDRAIRKTPPTSNAASNADAACAVLPPLTACYLMRVGQMALVPYYRPGDPAVADAIRGLAGRYALVLLANHGPVVAGDTLEAAVFATEELEDTAKLYLLPRGLNPRHRFSGRERRDPPGRERKNVKTISWIIPTMST
jgi:ribulose-5-phosphate 4-epimerase/fuculose-1-phosphate aldolase